MSSACFITTRLPSACLHPLFKWEKGTGGCNLITNQPEAGVVCNQFGVVPSRLAYCKAKIEACCHMFQVAFSTEDKAQQSVADQQCPQLQQAGVRPRTFPICRGGLRGYKARQVRTDTAYNSSRHRDVLKAKLHGCKYVQRQFSPENPEDTETHEASHLVHIQLLDMAENILSVFTKCASKENKEPRSSVYLSGADSFQPHASKSTRWTWAASANTGCQDNTQKMSIIIKQMLLTTQNWLISHTLDFKTIFQPNRRTWISLRIS